MTGAWLVFSREGAVVDASSRELLDVDRWLARDAIAAFWTCFELEWIGVEDEVFETRDGRRFSVLVSDEPPGWRLVVLDRTLQTRVEASERQAQRVRVLTDFAGGMARELIDPMSIVQAKLELILDLGITDPEVVQRHLTIALQHAERVSHVLGNLRRISQPQLLPAERWSVAALIEEVVELLGTPLRPRIEYQVESGLHATAPRAIAVRVVASLARASLQRRGEVRIAARTHRGRPLLTVGPTFLRRGRRVPPSPSLTSHLPLVLHLGGALEVFSDGEEQWIELALPRPAPKRARAASRAVQLLVLGGPAFRLEVKRQLCPRGFAFHEGPDRRVALRLLTQGGIDMMLTEVELEGPGPRGHALAHGLALRFPEVEFFVAVADAACPPPLGPVRFVRWPEDANELLRAASEPA